MGDPAQIVRTRIEQLASEVIDDARRADPELAEHLEGLRQWSPRGGGALRALAAYRRLALDVAQAEQRVRLVVDEVARFTARAPLPPLGEAAFRLPRAWDAAVPHRQSWSPHLPIAAPAFEAMAIGWAEEATAAAASGCRVWITRVYEQREGLEGTAELLDELGGGGQARQLLMRAETRGRGALESAGAAPEPSALLLRAVAAQADAWWLDAAGEHLLTEAFGDGANSE